MSKRNGKLKAIENSIIEEQHMNIKNIVNCNIVFRGRSYKDKNVTFFFKNCDIVFENEGCIKPIDKTNLIFNIENSKIVICKKDTNKPAVSTETNNSDYDSGIEITLNKKSNDEYEL